MKKLRTVVLVLVVAVLAAFMLFTVSCAPQGANLTYKFNQGDTTNYTSTMNFDVKMSTKDIPAKLADKMPKNQDMKMSAVMDTQQKVESVSGETAKILLTLTPTTMTMNVGGKDQPMPEDAKTPTTATMEIKNTGEIVSYSQESQGSPQDQRDGSQARLLMMTQVPAKTVKPGFTWTEPVDTEIPMGPTKMTMKGTVNYKFEKMENVKGVNLALITCDGDLNPKIDDTSNQDVSVTGTGKLTGKVYFDPAKGNIATSDKNLKLNMEMGLPIPGDAGAKPKMLMEANIAWKMEKK